MRRLKTWDTLAMVSLAAWHLIFFFPVTLGQKFFIGDDIQILFLPFRVELANALKEARLPLWVPGMGAGFPLFAEGEVSALDPINFILCIVFPTTQAVSYSILFRLIFMSVGMYLFCRAVRLDIFSALFAGFVFGFNGFVLAQLQHVPHLAVASWLPWLVLFQEKMQGARRNASRNWIVWFLLMALNIAFQLLGGFPQMFLINLVPFFILGIAAPLAWQRAEEHGLNKYFQTLALSGTSVLVGAGMAAVQWMPSAELLSVSTRSLEQGVKYFTSLSLEPGALTQFIMPFEFLGKPVVKNLEYWGYYGIVSVALGLFAFTRREWRVWVFCGIAILSLVFALGGNTPIYSVLYVLPLVNRFRVPARFLFPFLFAAIFLAAVGFAELKKRLRLPGKLNYALQAGILIWVVIDLALYAQQFFLTLNPINIAEDYSLPRPLRVIENSPANRIYASPYYAPLRANRAMMLGKTTAQVYAPLELVRNRDYLASITPAMASLFNVRYIVRNTQIEGEDEWDLLQKFDMDLLTDPEEFSPQRADVVEIISYTDQTQDLPTGFVAGEVILDTAEGNSIHVPLRLGFETADWAYEAYRASSGIKHPAPVNALEFAGYHVAIGREFHGKKYVAQYNALPALDVVRVSGKSFLSTGALILEQVTLRQGNNPALSVARLSGKNDFSVIFKSQAAVTFENRNALPHAFIVHSARVLSDEEAFKDIQKPTFDPRALVYLAEGEPLSQLNAPSPSDDRVEVQEYRSERVKLIATTTSAGYLILADSWYPGWVARMDGRDAAIYRADYIFRAVKLEPGAHTIEFEYRPESFRIGALISVASLVALFGASIFIWRIEGVAK